MGEPVHNLVLVESGHLDLEGEAGGWLVVPNYLVFIPANRAFTVRSAGPTTLLVAHLDPNDARWHHHGCWLTAAPQLAQEMLRHAIRWTPGDVSAHEAPRLFFRTLSHLCRDWFSKPRILWMPIARSEETRAAVTYLRDNIASATLPCAAAAAGCSARTLQRRCEEEFGFSWRDLLREVRIMRAMELLATCEHKVNAVSRAVGFRSLAAFTTSFSERVGMTPRRYLRNCKPRLSDSWRSDNEA